MGRLLAALLLVASLAAPVSAQGFMTCQSTLLACSPEYPNCNTVTCSDGSVILPVPAIPQVPSVRSEDGRALHLALAGYMTLNGIDLAQTMQGIGSGKVVETNPIMRPLSQQPELMGVVKMGATLGIVYAIVRVHRAHPRLAWALTGFAIAVESAVTIRNAKVLRTP